MSPPPLYLLLLLLLPLFRLVVSVAFADDVQSNSTSSSSSCGGGGGDRCGDVVLPFPFHLNSSSSCSSSSSSSNGSSVFRLSCVDGDGRRNSSSSSTLVLRLGAATFRVLAFLLPSGSLLLDYAYPPPAAAASSTLCDPAYAALSRSSSPAAALDGAAPFLGVTADNILRLYACEDSSLCRAGCDDVAASCGGGKSAAGCCYPLSDGSVWKPGDGLAVFAGFGCRGFSSWVKNRSSSSSSSSSPAQVMMRGIEVEWAVPRGSVLAACAEGAVPVNATTVRGGVRCACALGLVGDGFALGTGCSKPACSDGDGGGEDCCHGRFCSKKAVALAGFFVSVFFLAAAMSFWLFLRQPSENAGGWPWDLDPACIPKKILGSMCNARQFTYEQLEAATKRFEDGGCGGEKPVGSGAAEVHAGVLDDGTVVAVQMIGYDTPEKLRLVLDLVELLPEVSQHHRNIARVVGFCLDPDRRAMILVHEHFPGGTLEDHLRQTACRAAPGGRAVVLTWYHRVNIAIELASALAYLLHAHDDAPAFLLHDLRSSDIFLDSDLTAKIAGYKLAAAEITTTRQYNQHAAEEEEQYVVRNYGHLLVELLTGLRHQHPLDTVAPKVREGRLHEVLDPTLLLLQQQAPSSSSSSFSGKLLPASAEEVRKVLEVAVRCLQASGGGEGEDDDGRRWVIGMGDVARELMHVVRDNMGSSSKIEISLEETFSSSSLLQMISMSPDTLHRHLP